MNFTEEVGAEDSWDEDREWPFVMSVWTVEARDKDAAS
jgi:hypothetical protein